MSRLSDFRLHKRLEALRTNFGPFGEFDPSPSGRASGSVAGLRSECNRLETQLKAIETAADASSDVTFTAPTGQGTVERNNVQSVDAFIPSFETRIAELRKLFAAISVSPSSGPAAGGTEITITGVGFKKGASVTVGGASATNVRWRDNATLVAVTPSGSAGAQDVVVTNPDSSTSTITGGFTYT